MILNRRPSSLRRSALAKALRAAGVCGVALLLLPDRVIIPDSPLSLPVLVAAVPAMSLTQETQAPPTGLVARAVAPAAAQPPAQAQTGSVSGTVIDQTGALVPGVKITLRSTAGAIQTLVTDDRGAYAFPTVNVGQYTIEAFVPGFLQHSRAMVVRAQPEFHNVVLHFGFETFVEVSVAAPRTPPAPSAPAQGPQRIGGDISAPNLIYGPKPVYPPGAYARQAQDSVRLDTVIGKDGTVQSVLVNPAQGGTNLELIRAATDAVKQWRYRPALLNGVPVEVPMTVTVKFFME